MALTGLVAPLNQSSLIVMRPPFRPEIANMFIADEVASGLTPEALAGS